MKNLQSSAKAHWFQSFSWVIIFAFVALMCFVAYVAFTRQSGVAKLDMGKMQKIRFDATIKEKRSSP